jgi:hypothetical protein
MGAPRAAGLPARVRDINEAARRAVPVSDNAPHRAPLARQGAKVILALVGISVLGFLVLAAFSSH